MPERRHFTRIFYLTAASLVQGQRQWPTQLIDVSLQGALLLRPEAWSGSDDKEYELSFVLSGSDIVIRMQVELTHEASKKLGFYCHHIDIDSASHLKRMIELNVGEEQLLYRELEQLLEEHQEHAQP
ncbi:type IV pilus assembly protein PilZ [Aeromonas encheleia]|uniref:Cyclic diguanosine monophosphate-binding protein n=1 Tax=Aeromonas encheleia TaxID=73010 RepID=A0AAE9SE56_9GAMM|nr:MULTISPECIES: PilZ domain-containing protein [Aeromonas]MBV7414082.1 PilZ domain-containing protein [Aeromonas sp. sif2433]MBV7437318.1 PilZ domain-containing protein [Aeromonas sp. sif2416]MBV7599369.1 PilZ domain-containing protein [Aeromonas sp. sia0103]UNP88091.1 PilZ domain-containing protein [Aeromonas encheleia]USV58102.1 PilZ domain-containing protein [Aeromonas encheleia]